MPHARIDYIMENIEDFYESHRNKLIRKIDPIIKPFADCLLLEINKSDKRLQNLKFYFIQKIKKMKLRYTLFLHRLEDWIVHSIKAENS